MRIHQTKRSRLGLITFSDLKRVGELEQVCGCFSNLRKSRSEIWVFLTHRFSFQQFCSVFRLWIFGGLHPSLLKRNFVLETCYFGLINSWAWRVFRLGNSKHFIFSIREKRMFIGRDPVSWGLCFLTPLWKTSLQITQLSCVTTWLINPLS